MKEFKIHIAESDGEQVHMSIGLRDWFAGQAMQGFLTGDYDLYPHEVAQKAYEIAACMMTQREAKDA